MPFTAQELANIANAHLDHYLKGPAIDQSIQDKPLLKAMKGGQDTFPGTKELIKANVQGDYPGGFIGYEHDDTVSYTNPAELKQASYPYSELHSGISITFSELKKDGITVEDSTTGEKTSEKSGSEVHTITRLMQNKIKTMDEANARSLNEMCWRDGSQSAKVFAGVQSIITLNPAVGVTGGIDRASNRWWRNRARVGALSAESGYSSIESITGPKITASASNQTLTKTLRSEARQLRRYGGPRNPLILAGSGFLEALELEVFEKGTYTQSGFVNKGSTDIGMADISMRGMGTFMYDPTLDDMGFSKFCYILDPAQLKLMVMDGEDMKKHSPARPAEKYVLYRAVTWTGGMAAWKLNGMGVYEVA